MSNDQFDINEIQITDIRYDLPDGRYGNIRFNDLLSILNKEERAKIMSMARTCINDDLYSDVIKEIRGEKSKDKILEKIKEESNKLDTLRAIRNYYKKQNDHSYRMERCENALQVSVDKIFELNQKLKELK